MVSGTIARLREWARLVVTRDAHALYLAARDPRVPWYAKATALGVAAYALSPIDLIPDFVPVLGLLDDVVIVPLGILLAIRMIPPALMAEHRLAAAVASPPRRTVHVVVGVWVVFGLAAAIIASSMCRVG